MQDTTRRVRQPHLRLPTALLLQIPPNARERAAGPSSSNERIDSAGCLRPNLRACSPVMHVRVGRVIELVRPDRAGQRAGIVACLVVVVPRVFVRHCGNRPYIGAEHSQKVDLLLALSVRHVDHAAVSFGTADVRQADACVARCAFHYCSAWLEPGVQITHRQEVSIQILLKERVGGGRERRNAPTISLRCLDNAKCGSILHAPTRVLKFRFAINFRARLL